MTLERFVEDSGTQILASVKLKIGLASLGRWLRGERLPSPLAWDKLRRRGIDRIRLAGPFDPELEKRAARLERG